LDEQTHFESELNSLILDHVLLLSLHKLNLFELSESIDWIGLRYRQIPILSTPYLISGDLKEIVNSSSLKFDL